MSKEYPLFPELSEEGQKEAEYLIEKFKEKLVKVAEEAISDLYVDIMCYIQTDSWSNFRKELLDGFRDYNNRKIQSEYDFKTIRQAIYKEFREDIIKDLDQDNLDKIKELEANIKRLEEWHRR